jgi:MFS family permease
MLWIVGGLLFVEFLSGAVWGIHRGLSSLFTREVLLITSFTQIGFVVSVFGVTKSVTNLGFGALSDRIGRRPVIVLGLISSALGGAMIALANGYNGMLLGTALIGLGGGSTFVGIMVSMVEAVPSRIGLAMGLFELAAYGGSSFGTTMGGYFAAAYGLRQPFFVLMSVSAVGSVLGFLLIPETKVFVKGERRDAARISKVFSSAFLRTVPLYIAGFSSKIMDSLVWSFLPLFLSELGVGLGGVAAIMSAFTFSWALLQPLTGHVSDRLGRKRITVLGLASAAASIPLFTLTSDFLLLLLCALVLGVEAALFYTPIVAMVSDIAPPELEGTLIGSYRFFRDMGYFVGPILLGTMADRLGLPYAFYVTSLCLFVAMIILQVASKETIDNTAFEDN